MLPAGRVSCCCSMCRMRIRSQPSLPLSGHGPAHPVALHTHPPYPFPRTPCFSPQEPVPAGGLQLPNRPAQSPEKFAPAAIGLLLAASAADHLASMLNLTELALSCRCWLTSQAAVEGVHIPAAQRAVEQAATDGELEEAEVRRCCGCIAPPSHGGMCLSKAAGHIPACACACSRC